jgi:hypothetical protein
MRIMCLANWAPHEVRGPIPGSDREATMKAFSKVFGGRCRQGRGIVQPAVGAGGARHHCDY